MTLLSWLYMGLVWGAIIALNVFCFYHIFKTKKDRSSNTDKQE